MGKYSLFFLCREYSRIACSGGNGTRVAGWTGLWKDDEASNQQWLFDMISRTSDDIHTALQNCPCIQQDFKSYLSDGLWVNSLQSTGTCPYLSITYADI